MNRKRGQDLLPALHTGLPYFRYQPWCFKCSRGIEKEGKTGLRGTRYKGRENCILAGSGTKYECREKGCARGGGRCLPQKPLSATYWIRRASLTSISRYIQRVQREETAIERKREREGEKATRATRCKTLPVNFIAPGTSSYTSTCTVRGGYQPPAFAYTLGRESDRGNIQTNTRAHSEARVYIYASVYCREEREIERDVCTRAHTSNTCLCTHRMYGGGCTCICHGRRVGGLPPQLQMSP